MLNTKLLKLLRGLSPEGMNHLRTYLSQKHKSTSGTFRIFTYIAKYHPDFEQNKAKLTREKVFKKSACESEEYMYGLCSNLCRDIENFLINTELNEDDKLRDVLLSRAYRKRGMDDFFEKHNQSVRKEILESEIPEQADYDALFRLSYDAVFHRNTAKLNSEYYDNLKDMETNLDLYYLLHKLRILCESKALAGIIDIEKAENQAETKEALLSIDYQEFIYKKSDNYLLRLYVCMVELYDKKDLKMYRQLKEEITDETKAIDPQNLSTLLIFLINFCSRKSKENTVGASEKNPIDCAKEIFDLYEFAIDEDLLQEEGYIPEIHYLSLIKIAVATKNFDRAREWIDYARHTKPEYQKNSRLLASAILHFAEGTNIKEEGGNPKEEYDKAHKLLNEEIKWRNINYKITARDLLTKIYYELDDDLLHNHINNVRKAIQRNADLSKEQKEANYNFLNMVKELTKYKQELRKDKNALPDKALLSQFKKRLMVYGEWCRKKLDELTGQSPARQT